MSNTAYILSTLYILYAFYTFTPEWVFLDFLIHTHVLRQGAARVQLSLYIFWKKSEITFFFRFFLGFLFRVFFFLGFQSGFEILKLSGRVRSLYTKSLVVMSPLL